MHPEALHALIRSDALEQLSDSEVASSLGLARTTVRDVRSRLASELCPRCWSRTKPITADYDDYAELLGLYLGDGHVLGVGRSYRLRISMDAQYPRLIADAHDLLARCFPANVVGRAVRDGGSCVILSVNHCHLPCLLPQHQSGSRKHERSLALELWQQAAVDAAPWQFLRGCIRSDGCVFVNRTGRYEYVSYDFSNRSSDLLGLFARVCEQVGVDCRRYDTCVRIYRRASVELMLANVGTKA